MNRNSQIILVSDMKLDKDYRNVLNYSEQQMLELCITKQIATSTNYSFLEPGKNIINTQFTYTQCLNSDYIAFQNPRYNNKWFFAFIDKVEYVSDKATKIYYTIDEFSTWYSYWTPKPCYVVREHVNDDTIGLHTIPEQLETGEYITLGNPIKLNNYDSGSYICMAVSEMIPEVTSIGESAEQKTINGIYTGLYYMIFTSPDFCTNMIKIYDKKSKADAIVSIFLVPKVFGISETAQAIVGTAEGISFAFLLPNKTDTFSTLVENTTLEMNTVLGGSYTPKNNKLFVYPYNYIVLTNNAGTDVPLNYEDFIDNRPGFKIIGSITPGCSIRCVPLNYKKVSDSDGSMNSYNFGIQGAKLPVCAWNSDTYTNWLTSNGVNIALSTIANIAQIGVGAIGVASGGGALAGVGAISSGVAGLVGTAGEVYTHSKVPDQARGNTSSGDITYSALNSVFTVYRMCLREEFARSIDAFFTKLGYKVNIIKTPNITGRVNFNFVQIAETENVGYPSNSQISVPASSMETINRIFRAGTTVWHNYGNLGDYSVDNSII